MPLHQPRAYYRFSETSRYLARISKPALQDLPPESIDLAVKLKLSILAEDSGDGLRSTSQSQAVAYLAFGKTLQPQNELTRQMLSFTPRSVEELACLEGQVGECRFGPPNLFTGYQPLAEWRPVDIPAGVIGQIPLGDSEPPRFLFCLQGTHFALRFAAEKASETGIFRALAGLRLTQRLLQSPYRPIDPLALMSDSGKRALRRPAARQEIWDSKTISDVVRRVADLKSAIDRAKTEDPTLVPLYEKERGQLQAHLNQVMDDRRRRRRFDAGDLAEAARKTIVNDCERAWRHLSHHRMPKLARFLKAAIRIGRDFCLYQPPAPAPEWIF